MRRFAAVICILFSSLWAATRSGSAQAVPAAEAPQLRIVAGGMVSGFQPDDEGPGPFKAESGSTDLIGLGAYADMHFTHWFQLEAEARWLRWNQFYGEHQDNYLLGPRVPIKRLGERTQLYGKVLIGVGKMTLPYAGGYGTFTDIAYGAALDYRLSRKITVKADFEFQQWPVWIDNQGLTPYGASIGVGYRVF